MKSDLQNDNSMINIEVGNIIEIKNAPDSVKLFGAFSFCSFLHGACLQDRFKNHTYHLRRQFALP